MIEPELSRTQQWASTMSGYGTKIIKAHSDTSLRITPGVRAGREAREELEARILAAGSSLAVGAGNRAIPEQPDPERTCFERDRDRIVHSSAFRRLAGKTQAVVFPADHQRTRLTHALEVAQCATSIARGLRVNVALTEAIALGHDCGHGPGGHASEEAFDKFIEEGYDHGPWGADTVLTPLNLCAETLDGIRNHSWSSPAPATIEGEIVSWADRIAYCAHDLEDAVLAGIVKASDIPDSVAQMVGRTRREQLHAFITGVLDTAWTSGQIGMAPDLANALAQLRRFNYERIYTRPESVAQSKSVIRILNALVEFYAEQPFQMPEKFRGQDAIRSAVTYVAGMTDRFAFQQAIDLLGWSVADLPPTM